MRKSGSGAGAGASAGDDTAKEDGEEEECAICLETLVDPLAPCAEQPSHRYCRGCVQELQRQKLPSCPLCRGKMQDAEDLFYESVQLGIRAKKAPTPAKRDALHAKRYDILHRVLRVDPSIKEAQYNLCNMYRKGEGVQQDFKQALAWYRKAADQGYAGAQHNLGSMYQHGEGVQQDFKQAALWFQKAADQGDTLAHIGLGELSENAADYQAAFASYRAGQAADRDLARAGMRRCLEKIADSRMKEQQD
jgi:TPR repeat protein